MMKSKFKVLIRQMIMLLAVLSVVILPLQSAFADELTVESKEASSEVITVTQEESSSENSESSATPELPEVLTENDTALVTETPESTFEELKESEAEAVQQSEKVVEETEAKETLSEATTAEKPCPTTVNTDEDEASLNSNKTLVETANGNGFKESVSTLSEDNSELTETVTTPEAEIENKEVETNAIYDCDATSIKIDNTAEQENNFVAEGTSGENTVEAGGDVEKVNLETGNVHVYGNVLTVLNVNGVSSEVLALVENFDNVSNDLVMKMPNATASERAQGLVGDVCGGSAVYCKSLSSFVLDAKNEAEVETNSAVFGNTGGNAIKAGSDIEDTNLKTGDVYAVINILNIINTNLINSRWQVVAVNVFGDVNGDLVLPSALELQEWFSVGTNSAGSNIKDESRVQIDLEVDNTAVVNNEVVLVADTGNNSMSTEKAEGGDIEDSSLKTGDAKSGSNINTVANTTLVNTKWVMGIVNILGDWSGSAENIPNTVVVQEGPLGLSFLSVEGLSEEETTEYLKTATAENYTESEIQENIDIENTADITNRAVVIAETGNNSLEAGSDIERSSITTGSAKALANIFTWANSTLINSDLYIGVINIFGNLTGKVVFGYGDLSISQELVKLPSQMAGSSVEQKILVRNNSPADMHNVKVEWHFDSQNLKLVSASVSHIEAGEGVVIFDLGDFAHGQSHEIALKLANLQEQVLPKTITSFAKVYGTGVEINLFNNESTIDISYTESSGNVTDASEGQVDSGNNSQSAQPNYNEYIANNTPANAQSQSQSQNVLVVQKTNSAVKPVIPGSEIEFTVKVMNTGDSQLQGVMLYDSLKGPQSMDFGEQTADIGELAPGQTIEIIYTIATDANFPVGTYFSSAFAKGIQSRDLGVVQSLTAHSNFVLQNSLDPLPKKEEIKKELIEEEVLAENADTPQVLGQVSEDRDPPLSSAGHFKSKSVTAKIKNSIIPDVLGNQASDAFASGFNQRTTDQNLLIPPIEQQSQTNERQLLNTIFVSLLIAIGYATANLKERRQRTFAVARKLSWLKVLGNKMGIF